VCELVGVGVSAGVFVAWVQVCMWIVCRVGQNRIHTPP
jgi:hypothetical protein